MLGEGRRGAVECLVATQQWKHGLYLLIEDNDLKGFVLMCQTEIECFRVFDLIEWLCDCDVKGIHFVLHVLTTSGKLKVLHAVSHSHSDKSVVMFGIQPSLGVLSTDTIWDWTKNFKNGRHLV